MDKDRNSFEEFLHRLDPDSLSVEQNYKNLRVKLSKFFTWKKCEDPEELTDETIKRTVKNIRNGEEIHTSNIYTYIYAIAKNVFREYVRARVRHREAVTELLESLPIAPSDSDDCRIRCLQNLSAEKIDLIDRYYSGEEARERIAQSQGMSINALRLQIHRIKNEMRDCHKDCLKQILKARN